MNRKEIVAYLSADEGSEQRRELMDEAARVKSQTVGDKVYLRGLIELSNRCVKNCYYCGIRRDNSNVQRYDLSDEQVLAAARYAIRSGYGSVVIQAGERTDDCFVGRVESLVSRITAMSIELTGEQVGITLSLGEQGLDTYKRWCNAGAHRYLLRIESSTEELYRKIHPDSHLYERRVQALHDIRNAGLQLGTGVMIGLPFQTIEHLADDLLFMKALDVDMCGMGPYIEHPDAPLAAYESSFTCAQRYDLSLRMIALLRILMPDINIAATTALHALCEDGRQAGIAAGANVIMPNLSPDSVRGSYKLYNNKPLSDVDLTGFDVAYGVPGDSKHWAARDKK